MNMKEYKYRNLGKACLICVEPYAVYNVAEERFREFQEEYDPNEQKYGYFTFSTDPPYAWELEKDSIIAAVHSLLRAHLEQRRMSAFNSIHFPYVTEHSVWTSEIDFTVVVRLDDPTPIDKSLTFQLQALLVNRYCEWRVRVESKSEYDVVIFPEFICVGDRPLAEVIDEQLFDWVRIEFATWEKEYGPLLRQLNWIKATWKFPYFLAERWVFVASFDNCWRKPDRHTHWLIGQSKGFQTPILFDATNEQNDQVSCSISYPIMENGFIGCRYTMSPVKTELKAYSCRAAKFHDFYVAISNSDVRFPLFRVSSEDIVRDEELIRLEILRNSSDR